MSRSAVVALGKLIGFVGINSKACYEAGPMALGGMRQEEMAAKKRRERR